MKPAMKSLLRRFWKLDQQSHARPWRVLLIVALSVFILETHIMLFISHFGLDKHTYIHLLDSVFLTLVLFPILYFFLYKPLVEEIVRSKKSQKELTLFHHLIEQSSDAIFIIDAETSQIIDANIQAAKGLGYSVTELQKMKVTEIEQKIPNESTWKKHLADVSRKKKLVLEGIHKTKEGREFPVEISVKLIVFDGKKYIAAIARDISERKEIQNLKHELITNVSHELNTPITIIKTSICNIEQGVLGQISDKQKNSLKIVDQNIIRLEKLVNNLIDLSVLESGQIELNLSPTNLTELVKEACLHVEERTKSEGLSVNTEFAQNIPFISADQMLLEKVLANLIDNAIRYAKHKISLQVKLDSANEQLEVIVSNDHNGEEIDLKQIDQLFKSFEQIDRPVGSGYHGLGLGLTVCKNIIAKHNGKIWVDAPSKKETAFHFTLPLVFSEN